MSNEIRFLHKPDKEGFAVSWTEEDMSYGTFWYTLNAITYEKEGYVELTRQNDRITIPLDVSNFIIEYLKKEAVE